MDVEKASASSYLNFFGHSIHKAWLILVGCCFLQAGGVGTILLSAGVFYVPICNELGFARSEISLWMTGYFLATIPAMPIAGQLFSKYNIRIVMSISIIGLVIVVGSMSVYTQLWQWVLSGALIGLFGACVLMMPSAVMVGNWFVKRTGFAMGVSACASALAGVLFSPLFQYIITVYGWRFAYLIEAVIVCVFCLPWAIFVFRLRPTDVGALPYGLNVLPQSSHKGEAEVPGVPYRKAIKSLSFMMVFIFVSLAAFLGSGFDTHMPGIAISLDFSAAFGALLLSALQLGSFVDKLLMGFLNDRIGVQKTVYVELLSVGLGILGLMVFRNSTLMLVSAFLFGVQDSLIAVSMPILIRQIFGGKDYVRLYSLLRVGVGIFGSFASVIVGLSYDLSTSFMPALAIAFVLCVLGVFFVTISYTARKNLVWES